MTTLVGKILDRAPALLNQTPIPYVGRNTGFSFPTRNRNSAETQMQAMGAVGTLFAVVHRTSNSTAQVEWKLWRKAASGKDEDRIEVTRHAALDIWNTPNPFYTRQLFVETEQQHIDLTGEGWWVVARNPMMRSIPLELWPVRPDRMTPIPSRDKYLVGYVYTGPDGEQVPLQLDEVIQLRMPNPSDPYRGMGPVQSLLTDIDSAKYSAEWNRNFFLNGAEPGGIVEIDRRLSDPEFDELTQRWREQHQGVANAHRVAILEQGKWVDRKFSQRDMQFAELRAVSRDTILEAFGMPKGELGITQDVNRANAETGSQVFASRLVIPRLERIKQALNFCFLPLFGNTTTGLEFDYDNPVEPDPAAEDASLVARSTAAKTLIDAGFDKTAVLAACDLPDIAVAATPEPPAALPPAPAPGQPAIPAPPPDQPAAILAPRNAADLPPDDLPDVSGLHTDLTAELDRLLADWQRLTQAQKDALVSAIRDLAENGTVPDLANLPVDSTATAAALAAAMTTLAASAAQHVVTEAAAQGVEVSAVSVTAHELEQVAAVVAALLADELRVSAVRAAMQAHGPHSTPAEVATQVRTHLASLSDAGARKQLGGALVGAQNTGRIETLRAAPEGALYASEMNDRNTCPPCRQVNGRWLGNISQMAQVERSYPGGAYGAYIDCLGGVNCRGTIVGVWRPDQVTHG